MRSGRSISFRALDATAIVRNLWQGGIGKYAKKHPGQDIELRDVDHVALMAPEDVESEDVEILDPRPITLPLEDLKRDLNYLPELHDIAAHLAQCVQNGERVLVLCWQGRNRSGLLTGLILNELGMPGHQAVRHIRSKRRRALSSTLAFPRYLDRLP